MTCYRFDLACITCGHPVVHRAAGTTTGTTVAALADCPACGTEHLVRVTLSASSKRPVNKPRRPPRRTT